SVSHAAGLRSPGARRLSASEGQDPAEPVRRALRQGHQDDGGGTQASGVLGLARGRCRASVPRYRRTLGLRGDALCLRISRHGLGGGTWRVERLAGEVVPSIECVSEYVSRYSACWKESTTGVMRWHGPGESR